MDLFQLNEKKIDMMVSQKAIPSRKYLTSVIIYLLIISLSGIINLPLIAHAAIDDQTPPIIRHAPPDTLTQGEEMEITAIVEDDSAISWVNLWYRIKGEGIYKKVLMKQTDPRTYKAVIKVTNETSKLIPPPQIEKSGGGQGEGEQRLSLDETNYGIEYYIEATDQFSNEGTDGEKARPYFVEVRESPVIPSVAGETGIGSTGLSTSGSEKPCDSIFCKPLFWAAILAVAGGAIGIGGAGSGSKGSSNSNNNTTNVSVSW